MLRARQELSARMPYRFGSRSRERTTACLPRVPNPRDGACDGQGDVLSWLSEAAPDVAVRVRHASHQLEDGVGAMSLAPEQLPPLAPPQHDQEHRPDRDRGEPLAIRNGITAAMSCSVIPDPATLDIMPMQATSVTPTAPGVREAAGITPDALHRSGDWERPERGDA
jgi:hypothetical protein